MKTPDSWSVQSREMSDTEQMIRLGIGCAAAASAIFAPLSYVWKGVLTAVAADGILTGLYRVCPVRSLVVR